jgi:hypothetical protein
MMRTVLYLTAGLAAVSLAACNKPAEAPQPAGAAVQSPGAPGGGGYQMPEKQTLDDMLKRTDERFAKVDTNGDGKITPEEMEAAGGGGGGGGGMGGGGRGGGFGMLARADANKDGVVTKAEAEDQARKRFATMDADHDGTVTREEMMAARDRFRPAGGGGEGGGPPPPPN